jgi:GNAT superfamily N-acetyltransferase
MAIIEVVADGSSELDGVMRLWRANRKTLGPYPKGAFAERAQKGQVIAAVEDGSVVGYALFYPSERVNWVRLSHLCVDESKRKQGLARQLIDELDLTPILVPV